MIPDADTLIGALTGVGRPVNEKAIRASVQHARSLAKWPIDEPAAVFFAFSMRPRGFAPIHFDTTMWLVRDVAAGEHVALRVDELELRALYRQVAAEATRPTFDAIREWFAERIPTGD